MSVSLLILEFNQTEKDSIKGDCSVGGAVNEGGFEEQISLESFKWSLEVDWTIDDNKKDRASVQLKVVNISKLYDRASISMCNMINGNNGTSRKFYKATLRFVEPVNSRFEPIMEMELLDGYIDEITFKVAEGKNSMSVKEDITLSFRKIKMSYFSYNPKTKSRSSPIFFVSEQPEVAAGSI